MPLKLLIGIVTTALSLVVGAVWDATQCAACQLGYQSQLGVRWLELLGVARRSDIDAGGLVVPDDQYAGPVQVTQKQSGAPGCRVAIATLSISYPLYLFSHVHCRRAAAEMNLADRVMAGEMSLHLSI